MSLSTQRAGHDGHWRLRRLLNRRRFLSKILDRGRIMPITQLSIPAFAHARLGRLTVQRRARMHALLGELSLRDMDYEAVAAFLDCSCSAARSYMKDLRERALVSLTQRGGPYRITGDEQAIVAFSSAQGPDQVVILPPSNGQTMLEGGRRFHILFDEGNVRIPVASAPAERDPLVSALFGK